MPFTTRSAATIRDAMLADWRARYLALTPPADIDIQKGSDAWIFASVLALEIEAGELLAQANALKVLIREAFGADLDKHLGDYGMTRRAATTARRHVTVTGTASSTVAEADLTSKYLSSSTGLRFDLIDADGDALTSITFDGSGNAEVLVECATAGTEGNVATSAVLTWSSAPSGMGATGTVTSTTTSRRDGAVEESDTEAQDRLLERLEERPASGNRADWASKVREVTRVAAAYVYPLLRPPSSYPGDGTPEVPGCVTVVVMGPIATDANGEQNGDAVVNTRIYGDTAGANLTQIEDFLEGTRDATLALAEGDQWRPVTMVPGSYSIEAVRTTTSNVVAQLVLAAGTSWAWSGGGVAVASSSGTTITIAGNQTAKNSKDVLIFVGTSLIRGGYQKVNLGIGDFSGGINTVFTVTGMLAAPFGTMYPAPSNWAALRLLAFAYFDALGPGDVDTDVYPDSARWPTEATGGRSTFYRQALAAALMGNSGVLSATITSPGADNTPTQKAMVSLGTFVVTE